MRFFEIERRVPVFKSGRALRTLVINLLLVQVLSHETPKATTFALLNYIIQSNWADCVAYDKHVHWLGGGTALTVIGPRSSAVYGDYRTDDDRKVTVAGDFT